MSILGILFLCSIRFSKINIRASLRRQRSVMSLKGNSRRGAMLWETFLDIKNAFNNTSHEVVCREAALRGVPDRLIH